MKKRGFTLIELVAVLAISSIIIAIASLKFNIIENFKSNLELQTLINDCNYAKMKAISTGDDYKLVFNRDYYYISLSWKDDKNAIIKRDLENIRFSSYNVKDGQIIFNRSGSVTNPGTVKIEVPDGTDENKLVELSVRVGIGYARFKK